MWWWVIIWLCLFLMAGLYLGTRVRALWRQTMELGSELGAAERRLDAVQGQLERLDERIRWPEQLAVFADPATVRRQLDRARADGRNEREERLATSRPAWAKHVD